MKLLHLYFFAFLCALTLYAHTKVKNDARVTVPAKTPINQKNAKSDNKKTASKKRDDQDEDSDLIKTGAIKKDEIEYPSDEEAADAQEEISHDDKKFFATEARLQEYLNKP